MFPFVDVVGLDEPTDLSNGVLLCSRCHHRVHSDRSRGSEADPLGRSSRLFSRTQFVALWERDRGCASCGQTTFDWEIRIRPDGVWFLPPPLDRPVETAPPGGRPPHPPGEVAPARRRIPPPRVLMAVGEHDSVPRGHPGSAAQSAHSPESATWVGSSVNSRSAASRAATSSSRSGGRSRIAPHRAHWACGWLPCTADRW